MQKSRGSYRFEVAVISISALLFYFATACPTIGFSDTALLLNDMHRGRLSAHVNNHPLTVLVGSFFLLLPLGTPAFSGNLVSVLFGALAVSVLFVSLRSLGLSLWVALVATAPFVVLHSMWWHSTIVENYALSAFLVGLCYFLLLQYEKTSEHRYFYGACLVAALSVSNHVQNSLLCLGVAIAGSIIAHKMEDQRQKLRFLGICAASAFVGLLPWALLLLKDAVNFGWKASIHGAFFGNFESTFFSAGFSSAAWEMLRIFWNQSPLLLLPVGAILGLIEYRRRFGFTPNLVGMLTHIGLTVLVFSGYPTWDRFAFLLVAFWGLSFFVGLGLFFITESVPTIWGKFIVTAWSFATVASCVFIYSTGVSLDSDRDKAWFWQSNNSYSGHLYNQAEYIANPNKRGYREVEDFADLLFKKLPQGSIFLDDDSRGYYALASYFQGILRQRQDVSVLLVNAWGFSNWGLSQDRLTGIVEDAYRRGRPFFVTTPGFPYSTFFSKISNKFPVRFEKFPLSDTRWVYKLVTASSPQDSMQIAREAVAKRELRAVELAGDRGEINLRPEHVFSSVSNGIVVQDMTAFGPQWAMADQLFIGSGNPGSEFEFYVTARSERAWNLRLHVTTAPDFGFLQIEVNDKVVATYNAYSVAVDHADVALPQMRIPPDGVVLRVRVIGKDTRASWCSMGIDSIRFF